MHPVRVHRYHSTDMQKLYCIIYRTATDPCCGSGGMFVQSIKFVEAHSGNKKNVSVYGQER